MRQMNICYRPRGTQRMALRRNDRMAMGRKREAALALELPSSQFSSEGMIDYSLSALDSSITWCDSSPIAQMKLHELE
jgi:hypothetical protein